MSGIGRIARIMWAALRGETHLWLRKDDRGRAACDIDDASLVKWVRWALVMSRQFYENDAKRRDRDLYEVVTMHGVISLALMVLRSGGAKATFDVEGVTFNGDAKGDWRVTIERIAAPDPRSMGGE